MGPREEAVGEVYYEIWELDEGTSMSKVMRNRDGYLVDRKTGLVVSRVLAVQMRVR